MKQLPDESVDMILCDLPYGTTASKWDKVIDSKELWKQYQRIVKPKGAIVLFSSGRFTNLLINSNIEMYRYKWIWIKTRSGNFVNAKNRPMTKYEEICVFSKGITANTKDENKKMNYYPQGLIKVDKVVKNGSSKFGTMHGNRPSHKNQTVREFTNYPSDVLEFPSVRKPVHPTEKPIPLLEYLVKTYTKKGDVILDNCMGSGSTGVACLNTDRKFIGIELEPSYFHLAEERINKHLRDIRLF